MADSLWAVHTNLYDDAAERDEKRAGGINSQEKAFVGMGSQDSNDLFQLLQRHLTRLDNTVRWNWASGDIAMWDNHVTQHYAVDDYDDQPRLLHRITLAGSVPISADGRRSRPVKGDASSSSSAVA